MAADREAAIRGAADILHSGRFEADLLRLVSRRTASREPEAAPVLRSYAERELRPLFEAMGFNVTILTNEAAPGPFLFAERLEEAGRPTILQYGHGDVVSGLDREWSPGLSPWELTRRENRWYGRGTADNKGQHLINISALRAVLETRGRIGFNVKFLIEMGEECGSIGLREVCEANREMLTADLFLASDGPRLSLHRPTIFLGARGGISFNLAVEARDGFHHSGNWGGLLSNPGILLAHAIACLIGPSGQIRVPELVPPPVAGNVRLALADCAIVPLAGDPVIEEWWGEPGLTSSEKVFGWSSLEVMEFECGNLQQPLYAIPPSAKARMQLRFPVGVDPEVVVPAVRRHLDRQGLSRVEVTPHSDAVFGASRLDPDHPWVKRIAASMERTLGKPPAILPNLGGSLPNNIFCDLLGLPTIWVPHSYPGCRQHGADEHLPIHIAEEGLRIMAGIYFDLGTA